MGLSTGRLRLRLLLAIALVAILRLPGGSTTEWVRSIEEELSTEETDSLFESESSTELAPRQIPSLESYSDSDPGPGPRPDPDYDYNPDIDPDLDPDPYPNPDPDPYPDPDPDPDPEVPDKSDFDFFFFGLKPRAVPYPPRMQWLDDYDYLDRNRQPARLDSIRDSRIRIEFVPYDYDSEFEPSDPYYNDYYDEPFEMDATNDDDDDEGSTSRRIQPSNYLKKFESTCGKAQLNGLSNGNPHIPLVVNGQDQEYGEWPSYVQLTLGLGTLEVSSCGGTLISDRHVLTASHCLFRANKRDPVSASSIEVTFGQHDLGARDQYEYSVRVKRICRSQNYVTRSDETLNDWAVLELVRAVRFDNHTSPACLTRTQPETSGEMSKCWLVGAGASGFSNGYGNELFPETPSIVQKMRVERVKCRGWSISDNDKSRSCYTKAFNQPGDSCQGDSGGPVLCLDKDKRWSLVGLVSYGTKYCNDEGPAAWVGVYANVNSLFDDIEGRCFNGGDSNYHS